EFHPASGSYHAGEEATSLLRFENTGRKSGTFWVGYSVRDEVEQWHDVPARRVRLEAGKESKMQYLDWAVPDEPPPPSGSYEVVAAVWSEKPGESEARRLTDATRKDAFRVAGLDEDFTSLDGNRWEAPSKNLGRGSLKSGNVQVESGRLTIKIPAGSHDGGEIESKKLYQYGSYRARIKVADAPSSITGFFLYSPPDFENEIDVEIYNDHSRRILFTTYSGGVQTNTVTKKLPFDPTADFHEYRFDLSPDTAYFYVDGVRLQTFRDGLPAEPMKLFVNSWFPTWLPGEKQEKDSYTYIDWVKH
ncbi:MAG: glycoside hydrolase family 16 protein, partial [Rubrobacteraceae bacterium]